MRKRRANEMFSRKAVLILLVVGVLLGSLVAPVAAAKPGVTVLTDPQAKWFGRPYGEWTVGWWQWAASFAGTPNPFYDTTSAACRLGQRGSVWFLAGAVSNTPVTRYCTIPAGKALLIPVLNASESLAFNSTYDELKADWDANYLPYLSDMQAWVDGQFIAPTYVFWPPHGPSMPTLTYPDGNIFGNPPGRYNFISAGYYIFVKLAPGAHTVHTHGNIWNGVFEPDVTFQLTIK
jgi:hypothetical protein